ncbi:hypothetical protein BDK51DRAFT_52565 [Blyttiomyces helicus]|uniref:PX domain-containing protein n=1 Tax=Blyttiomyces helicus TaxID=388810 RepID=A0A4P9W3A8_9FUNG|nr:hypothetical protein BDK51DRAFT_52565 [Blyttiomyces helicus]|eukprot:RKO85723.1 hypothetical protein BDK51DRAFT_52565 [Blyttiomyces helicus]
MRLEDQTLPFFLSLSANRTSHTGIVMYFLREGTTLIGARSAPATQDLILDDRPTIAPEQAVVTFAPDQSVTLRPASSAACVRVNGVGVMPQRPARLRHGDRVEFGPEEEAQVFRFNQRGGGRGDADSSLPSPPLSPTATGMAPPTPPTAGELLRRVGELERALAMAAAEREAAVEETRRLRRESFEAPPRPPPIARAAEPPKSLPVDAVDAPPPSVEAMPQVEEAPLPTSNLPISNPPRPPTPPAPPTTPKLEITIPTASLVTPRGLSKAHHVYILHVRHGTREWTVRRRFNEFYNLNTQVSFPNPGSHHCLAISLPPDNSPHPSPPPS